MARQLATTQPDQEHETVEVEVRARDLDTGEQQTNRVDVSPPVDEVQCRALLTRVVTEAFPEARIRSYTPGVASFLGKEHLIVAALPKGFRFERTLPEGSRHQQALFTV